VLEVDEGHAAVGIVGDLLPNNVGDPVEDALEEVGVDRPFQLVQPLGDVRQVHHRQRAGAPALIPAVRALDELAHHRAGRVRPRTVELAHAPVAHRVEEPAPHGGQRRLVGQDEAPAAEGIPPELEVGRLCDRGGADGKAHPLLLGRLRRLGHVHDAQGRHVEDVEHHRAAGRAVAGIGRRAGIAHEVADLPQGARVTRVGGHVRRDQQAAQRLPWAGVAEPPLAAAALGVLAKADPVLAVAEAAGQHLPVLREGKHERARRARLRPCPAQDAALDRPLDGAVVGRVECL
jgi:hypothetical protein